MDKLIRGRGLVQREVRRTNEEEQEPGIPSGETSPKIFADNVGLRGLARGRSIANPPAGLQIRSPGASTASDLSKVGKETEISQYGEKGSQMKDPQQKPAELRELEYVDQEKLELKTKTKSPDFKDSDAEWMTWICHNRNDDFTHRPPLLQIDEKYSAKVENWPNMRCSLCQLVCPPQPYACSRCNHNFCFSCTSVIPQSRCPLYVNDELSVCGELLQEVFIMGYGAYFEEPRNRYHCPFRKFGCDLSGGLLPVEVVDHAQKFCAFRYKLKCIVQGCIGEEERIRVGFFRGHLTDSHRSINVELQNHDSGQPLMVDVDLFNMPTEGRFVPVVFVDRQWTTQTLFPLVMMKNNDFYYFWIYKISDRDEEPPVRFSANITLCPSFMNLSGDEKQASEITKTKILHEYMGDPAQVIKTRDVITLPCSDFVNKYVSGYDAIEGSSRYFYCMKISIVKVEEKKQIKVNWLS